MLKNAIIVIVIVMAFVGGGSYGYHLADERIGRFIQSNAMDNAIFYYKKSSEIIAAIEQGNSALAIKELETLKEAEAVLFESCRDGECPEDLRLKIESVYKPSENSGTRRTPGH